MRASPAKYNLAIPVPADYKSARPAYQIQLGAPMSAAARMGLFAQLPPAALFTRRAGRPALPGHRARFK